MKIYIYTLLVVLILLASCATQETTTPTQPQQQPTEPKKETPIEATPEEPTVEEEIIKIPNDIKEILEKGKTKLISYSYNHKSPYIDESYKIYVKGNKIKIIPPEIINVEGGKFYNTLYLDTEKKKAEAYCLGYSACGVNLGKIKDLNYKDAYIETPLDWLAKVIEAKKIDERTVENRKAIYLDTNIGKITVGSFNGFLYRIESGKQKWEFSDAAFDSVIDSDVTPP